MKPRRAAATLTLAASALAIDWVASSTASATSIIGFGNAASDNACTNIRAATAHGSGTAGGGLFNRTAVMPANGPANQCGGLSLPIGSDPCLPHATHIPATKGEALLLCKVFGKNPIV